MKQVLDIEQMQHLRELGLGTRTASSCWIKGGEYIPTFTLQEILDLLPKELDIEVFTHKWFLYIDYQDNSIRYAYASETGFYYLVDPIFCLSKHALIDAAYEMLCWCIEKGYIETNSNKEDKK